MTPRRPEWADGDDVFWLWYQMPWVRAGQMELALDIGKCHVDVAHSHLWINVSE